MPRVCRICAVLCLAAGITRQARATVNMPDLLQSADAEPSQLTIRIYNFAAVSPAVLLAASVEAAHVLRAVNLRLIWLDCTSPAERPFCLAPELPRDLTVRLLPAALPQASSNALGMTFWAESGASAALFYDRAVSLRRFGLFLPQILGRAMAHEIVHLLLPAASHTHHGLMRPRWAPQDLEIGNRECSRLEPSAVELIQRETRRRVAASRRNPHDDIDSWRPSVLCQSLTRW